MMMTRLGVMVMAVVVVVVLATAGVAQAARSVDMFGAVSGDMSFKTAMANAQAIVTGLYTVHNSTDPSDDRVLLVPKGALYGIGPIYVSGIHNVTLRIDGDLQAHDDVKTWPSSSNGSRQDVITFDQSNDISIIGSGNVRSCGRGNG